MSSHPTKPAKFTLSHEQQDAQIVNEALSSLEAINEGQRGTRRITHLSARTVVTRALSANSAESYSIRHHKAMNALSRYAALAQRNKVITASAENTDLLPIAHPLSTRPHEIAPHQLSTLRSRWYADDPMVTDPIIPSLLASAFSAPPLSPEREYALARLAAMGSTKVPREALVAVMGAPGANDYYWVQQLRDRFGKFMDEFGWAGKLVRRANGVVENMIGRVVSSNPSSQEIVTEHPNGRLTKGPANEAAGAQAVLPGKLNKDGFSGVPAKASTGDPIVDEADLQYVESPDGWNKNPNWKPDPIDVDYYGEGEDLGTAFDTESGNYQVIKFDKGQNAAAHKFEAAQQKEADGEGVVAYGKGDAGELDPELPVYYLRRNEEGGETFAAVQSWADVQRIYKADVAKYEKNEAPSPERPANVGKLVPSKLRVGNKVNLEDFEGKGARIRKSRALLSSKMAQYRRMLKKFKERGAEFPIDPSREHFILDDGTIIDAETGIVVRDNRGFADPDAWKKPPVELEADQLESDEEPADEGPAPSGRAPRPRRPRPEVPIVDEPSPSDRVPDLPSPEPSPRIPDGGMKPFPDDDRPNLIRPREEEASAKPKRRLKLLSKIADLFKRKSALQRVVDEAASRGASVISNDTLGEIMRRDGLSYNEATKRVNKAGLSVREPGRSPNPEDLNLGDDFFEQEAVDVGGKRLFNLGRKQVRSFKVGDYYVDADGNLVQVTEVELVDSEGRVTERGAKGSRKPTNTKIKGKYVNDDGTLKEDSLTIEYGKPPRFGNDGRLEAWGEESPSDIIEEDGAQPEAVAELPDPEPEPEPEPTDAPKDYYQVDRGEYIPEGAAEGQESDDYTDDPSVLAEEYSTADLTTALKQAVQSNGFGLLPFSDGDEVVPAEALYNALKEKGEDADQILDAIYKEGAGVPDPEVTPDVEEALGGDDVPAAPEADPEDPEEAPKLPALLESLTPEELEQFLEDGDYQKYFPEFPEYGENDVPEGYYKIESDPFQPTADDVPEGYPEGFSVDPLDIARNYETQELIQELRRALEPDAVGIPGYGILGVNTPEGETFFLNVPAEAIRDALELQGVDTKDIIDDLYAEGRKGQDADAPTPEEIEDAIEGEDVQEGETPEAEEDGGPEAEEQPAEAEEVGLPPENITPVDRDELSDQQKQELDAAVREPYRTDTAVKDLQPGDIAVRDGEYFVIEEIQVPDVKPEDENNKGVNRVVVKGYYPGHESQERNWFANLEIEVIRDATPPAKGELPALQKPELADYGRLKKEDGVWGLRDPEAQEKYDNDYAEFQAQVRNAAAAYDDPTKVDGEVDEPEVADDKPEDGPFITKDRAADLQPGDISKKDHFVIQRVFTDGDTKPGFVSIEGYYPGYGLQRKEWRIDTPIEVIRGVPENEMPEQGEGSLHRPAGKGPKGNWFPDPDPAANAEHQRKLEEARDRWQEPENLPVVTANDAKGENQLQEAPKQPKAPFLPAFPPFQGFFADIAKKAQGKWQAFKDALEGREIIVFDFETTGIMPEDGNEPWQIAYRKIVNGKEVATGGIFMNPGRSIKGTYAGENAMVDGKPLTDEFLAQQMSQKEAFEWIKRNFGDAPLLIAHNAKFDVEILERKFKEFGIEFNPEGIADTMAMAEQFYKDDAVDEDGKRRKKNLKAVAEWLGVKLDDWHNADSDVGAASEIFRKLIDKGIKDDQGLDALDADARQAEYDQRMERAKPAIEAYEKELADYWAAKALQDGVAGKPIDLDELQKRITPQPIPEGPIDNGQPMDNPDIPDEPQADLVDVSVDSIFPDGKMRIVDPEWVNDLENVEQVFRGEIKVEDLRPGDFVRAKRDSSEFWQVIAVRGGEQFGIEEFKRAVFVQNAKGEQRRVYWNQNAFLDEVRRPKNRADLVPAQGEPVAPAAPERSEDSYTVPVSVPAGKGIVKVRKEGDEFIAEAILEDGDGNVIYNANARNLDKATAEKYARRLIQVFAEAFERERKEEAGTPAEEAKSVAVGTPPENAGEIPRVDQIDDLPFGEGENEITPKQDGDDVVYESNGRVLDEDGDVQGQVIEEFPNEKAASEGGRQNVEGISAKIARKIRERALLMTPGRNRNNLPEIPAKYRRQVFIRLLAGLYGDADGNPLAVGDRVIHVNPEKAAKYGEGVVINKIQGAPGGIQRKGVVYVDYVVVRYPDGSRRKFVSRFQKHVDADIARERFDAEPRINWMNDAEMKEALEERAKKPRKQGKEGAPQAEAPEAEAPEAPEVQEVQNIVDEVEKVVEPEAVPDAPDFQFNIDWIKENALPRDIRVGDIQVGDFMPTKGDKNVGRVVRIEDLDRAVRIEVEYPDGHRWTYRPYNKNFTLNNIYRLDGMDKAPEAPEAPEAPQAEAPEAPAPEAPQTPQAEAPEAPTPEAEAPEAEAPAPADAEGEALEVVGKLFNDLSNDAAILEGLKKIRDNFLPKWRNPHGPRPLREITKNLDDIIARMERGKSLVDLTTEGSVFKRMASKAEAYNVVDNKWHDPAKKVGPELEFLGNKIRDARKARLEALAVDINERQKDGVPQGLVDFGDQGVGLNEADGIDKLEEELERALKVLPENDRGPWGAERDLPDYKGQQAAGYIKELLKEIRDKKSDPAVSREALLEALKNDAVRAARALDAEAQSGGIRQPFYREMADKFENLYRDIGKAEEREKVERVRLQLEEMGKPLDSALLAEGSGITKAQLSALMDELIKRLPDRNDTGADRNLYKAKDAFQSFKDEVARAADPIKADLSELITGIDYIKGYAGPGAPELDEAVRKLERQVDAIREVRRNAPVEAFGAEDLGAVDPAKKAEERIAAGANLIKPEQEVVDTFASDNEFDQNPALQPFKDKIREFFDGEEKAMAALGFRERIALMQWVGKKFKNGDGTPALRDLALKLYAEEKAYQPQRPVNNIGDKAQILLNFSPADLFNVSRGSELMNPDGSGTGWVKKIVGGGGINKTHMFENKDTGQTIWVKQEGSEDTAEAEKLSAELGAIFGINGMVAFQTHPQKSTVILLTAAGENIRKIGGPKEFRSWSLQSGGGDSVRRGAEKAPLIDLIKMGIFDAIIANSDRHGGNFLMAEKDQYGVEDNGFDNVQMIPIDHGYAAMLNGGATGRPESLERFLMQGGRTGGDVNRAVMRMVGIDNYKAFALTALREARVAFVAQYGENPSNDKLVGILDRMDSLLQYSDEKWENIFRNLR